MDIDSVIRILRDENFLSPLFFEKWSEVAKLEPEEKSNSIWKIAMAQVFKRLSQFVNRLTASTLPEDQQTALVNLLDVTIKVCAFVRDQADDRRCQQVAERRDFRMLLTAMKKCMQTAVDDSRRMSRRVTSELRRLLDDVHREAVMSDQFRHLSLLPTIREINKKGFNPISRVIVKGPYEHVEHYLDLQFRLLREDYVGAVRAGVQAFKEALAEDRNVKRRYENIRVYLGVHFERSNVREIGTIAYVVNFEPAKNITANYEISKYFMHGSLLFFSRDDFRTFFHGIIHGHDIAMLNSGRVCVKMEVDEDLIFGDDATFTMIEANVFWEPYSLVLQIWREFNEVNFPMREFIVEVSTGVDPPSYLYKLKDFKVYGRSTKPLDFETWPTCEELGDLDQSQYEALKTALTKKFCIIQGPPGTGKTRLGLKIVRILLTNMARGPFIRSPILVICYTNHALDQFLEGILDFTHEIVRVGGQSRCEKLDKYNLKQIKASRKDMWRRALAEVRAGRSRKNKYFEVDMYEMTKALLRAELDESHILDDPYDEYYSDWDAARITNKYKYIPLIKNGHSECKSLLADIDVLNKNWDTLKKPEGIFSLKFLKDVMKEGKTVLKSDFAMVMWLLDEKESVNKFTGNFDFLDELKCDENAARKEIFSESKPEDGTQRGRIVNSTYSVTMNGLALVMRKYKGRLQSIVDKNSIEYAWARTDLTNLIDRFFILRENMDGVSSRERPRRMKQKNDLLKLPLEDRWNMYFSWIADKKTSIQRKIWRLKEQFVYTTERTNKYQEEEDAEILGSAQVIAMTTSGGARYNNVLLKVKPSIVIVEEAAEVLEAHIVANLNKHTEHLIMIGDHKQLKPSVAMHELSTNYDLDCSLFERMIENGMYCPVLKVQHRMRPEISSLIKPIYKKLQNHKDVETFESVRGVLKDVYFVDHENYETAVEDSTSYVNIHEADFVLELCSYLIDQGYNPERITLLTTYMAQMHLIKQNQAKMRKLEGVRACVVDEYQGEENNIIILSLVRSNQAGKIGFLKTENRICVALSRARIGLYIIGNMSILTRTCAMWRKIKEKLLQLRGKGIGPALTLRCEKHGTFTDVATAHDFNAVKGGGCNVKCGGVLACTHTCTHSCHIADPDHKDEFACRMMLDRALKCGHTVTLACSVQEYSCTEPVQFQSLHCKHTLTRECSNSNVSEVKCENICGTKLDCGHKCPQVCHPTSGHTDYVCEEICGKRNRTCPKNHTCQRKCGEECGVCSEIENIRLDCGHSVRLPCSRDTLEVRCSEKCTRICADCSAPGEKQCWEDWPPCSNVVEKIIEECGHSVRVPCSDTPTRENCDKLVTVDQEATCGHNRIYGVPCGKFNDFDPEDYCLNCEEPCGSVLSCKHVCTGSCRDCMQGRQHVGCKRICNADLGCGHKCPGVCGELCPPCREDSLFGCCHMKEKRRCGAFYSICEEPCEWQCEHQKCTKDCGEVCDREPCEESCPLQLPECGHPCLGFCGDPCPPICGICHETDGNVPDGTKYVLLVDCGCVIASHIMEHHLKSKERHVAMFSCPKCDKSIMSTMRYMNRVKVKYKQIVDINKRVHSLDLDLINKRDGMINTVKAFSHEDEGPTEALKKMKVEFLGAVLNKHNVVSKQCLTNIDHLLQLFNSVATRLNSTKAGLIDLVDFKKGMDIFSEVVSRVELEGVVKNVDQMTGLRNELIRVHRLVDYCVLLRETPAERLRSNERLNQIRERVRALCYRRKVFTVEENREVGDLFDEFFRTEPKKGMYSFDDPTFNRIIDTDLKQVSVRGWLVCENEHFYHAVDENNSNCPQCSTSPAH